MVHSSLGLQDVVIGATLHLHNHQLVAVQRNEVDLQMSPTVVVLQDDVPLIRQVPRRHLLPYLAELQRLASLLRRAVISLLCVKLQQCHNCYCVNPSLRSREVMLPRLR